MDAKIGSLKDIKKNPDKNAVVIDIVSSAKGRPESDRKPFPTCVCCIVSRFHCCLCCVYILALLAFFIYYTYKHSYGYPTFAISNLNLISSSTDHHDKIGMEVIVANPNSVAIIYNDDIVASLFYNGSLVAKTSLHLFSQRGGNITLIDAKLISSEYYLSGGLRKRIFASEGVVNFDVKIAWNATIVGKKTAAIAYNCDQVGVLFDHRKIVGNMILPLKQCS